MSDSNRKDLQEPLLSHHYDGHQDLTVEQLGFMFHPDNIKNYHPNGGKVSHSIYNYFKLHGGAAGVARSLKTSLKTGIEGTPADLKERVNKYGSNKKRLPRIRTLCELVLENFEDRILQILLMAATLALIIGVVQHGWKSGWVEGIAIYAAVAIIVSVTAGNNYAKEKQFQKLVSKANEDYIAVFRGSEGLTITVLNDELVVGDLIKIEAGMRIPADCVLVDGTDVATDESSMTGEPEQVDKSVCNDSTYIHNPCPFLTGNTLVVSGQGTAIVCAVGSNTRSGMAEEKLNIEDEITPLQAKLETIANTIGKVGVYVAILTFIAMCVNLVVKKLLAEQSITDMTTVNKIVDFVIIAITVIVVSVPEGLPLAVTMALAFSVMKMKKENNLVRKLDASETMGGANEICTDKTGTLTKNQMTVKEFYSLDQVYAGRPQNFKSLASSELLQQGVLFNCSARIERDAGRYVPKGNCTEIGLINFLMEVGVDAYDVIRQKEGNILQQIPFNSARKRACTVVRSPLDQNKVLVFTKGAPEIVIDYCGKYLDQSGKAVELTAEAKDRVIKEIVTNTFAKKAFRTLLIAHKEITYDQYLELYKSHNNFHAEADREVLENDLTIVGIYALYDPLRDEIVESVRKCHRAGINIRMVTGDNIDTAKAIAVEAGLVKAEDVDKQYVSMEGREFRELCGGLKKLEDPSNRNLLKEEIGNKKMFRDISSKLKVLARSTPEDKYMLVTGLKELNAVVAVTGDGTNDAPALKKADVGFAMGITGTEVAKEASDIILLDDNFASIVTAVKWGRNIYTNVRKFLQFQLTVNVVAMFIVFLGGVVVADPPLTAVQMLWVNLIMDTCAALALATEPPSDDILEHPPYTRTELIVTPVMWRNIMGQAFFQSAFLVVMLFAGKQIFGIEYDSETPFYYEINGVNVPTNKTRHFTLIFHTFVFMQVFNEINSRKLGVKEYNVFQGFFNNALFTSVIILTIIVQCVLVEYGGKPVRTCPLSYEEHAICLVVGMLSLIQGVLVKAFLPVSWFNKFKMNEDTMSDEEEKNTIVANFRKSFRSSIRKSGVLAVDQGSKKKL